MNTIEINAPLQRKVKTIKSSSANNLGDRLIDFLHFKNLIILGSPGTGKTYTLQALEAHENSKYTTVTQFRSSRGRGLENKKIALDALDEHRLRSNNGSAVNDITDILHSISPESIRLSCRSTEWLGGTDLECFLPHFDDNYAVIELLPITLSEQSAILKEIGSKNPCEFLRQIHKQGLDNLVSNPLMLIMMEKLYRKGSLPASKSEVFDKTCSLLLTEQNENWVKLSKKYSSNQLFMPSSALYSSLLISETNSISALPDSQDTESPSIFDITFFSHGELEHALKRNIFRCTNIEGQKFTYPHRMIAEYMSGKWISSLINRNNDNLDKFLDILCHENTVPAELKGLFAWTAFYLDPKSAKRFIEIDPICVLTYSDANELEDESKINLIKSINLQSIKEPFIFQNIYEFENIKNIVCIKTENQFTIILKGEEQTTLQMKNFLLEILSHSNPALGLKSTLLDLVENPHNLSELSKITLVDILSKEDYHSVDYLKKLIDKEEDFELKINMKIRLFEKLYPSRMNLDYLSETVLLIRQKSPKNVNLWHIKDTIQHRDLISFFKKTIPHIDESTFDLNSQYELGQFYQIQLSRILKWENFTYNSVIWLTMKYVQSHNLSQYKNQYKDSVQASIINNQNLLERIIQDSYNFYSKPSYWRQDLKSHITPFPDEDVINFMFSEIDGKEIFSEKEKETYKVLADVIFNSNINNKDEIFDLWRNYATRFKDLEPTRDKSIICELDLIDPEEMSSGQPSHLDGIKIIESLSYPHSTLELTQISYFYFRNLTREESHPKRLSSEVKKETINSILNSLDKLKSEASPISHIDLYNNPHEHQRSWVNYITLMDIKYFHKKNKHDIPKSDYRDAYFFSKLLPKPTKTKDNRTTEYTFPWIATYKKEYNEDYRDLLIKLATKELCEKYTYTPFTQELLTCEHTLPWRESEILELLKAHQKPSLDILRKFLARSISKPPNKQLQNIGKNSLSKHGHLRAKARLTWMLALFIDSPDPKTSKKLIGYCKSRDFTPVEIKHFFGASDRSLPNKLNELQLETIILCCAYHYPRTDRPKGEQSGDYNSWDMSGFICGLISALSTIPSRDAQKTLIGLTSNKYTVSYKDHCLQSLQHQKAIYSEINYRQLTWDETITFFENSNLPPTTSISINELRTALEEFAAYTSAQSRMNFWRKDRSTGKYKFIQNPENHAQNELRAFLTGKLTDKVDKSNVYTELSTGAGRVDLLIQTSMNTGVVLELKMCGAPYTFSYAQSGTKQISHYLTNTCNEHGFLVVFDARKRDFGKGFTERLQIDGHTIHSIAIDIRPIVKDKD